MGITVLSLFDGISCGQIALERTGEIKVDRYYASENKKMRNRNNNEELPRKCRRQPPPSKQTTHKKRQEVLKECALS